VTPEEQRAFYKKEGILPPKSYSEKPFFIASTGAIFDPYVPPEGDGRASFLSKEVGT
jgi:large subunit ribosomal protein L45